MTTPWLQISASDYEGHMGLPSVAQLSFLGQMFKESLAKYESTSMAYLGCATGNGLEYINPERTKKLTVIDINPEYLDILHRRYHRHIPNLEIIEADLNDYDAQDQRYSLIFAGLIFEYLAPLPLLTKITHWLEETGVLIVILQLPEHSTKKVSESPYSSLKSLASVMNLVSDQDFKFMAHESGLREVEGKRVTLESGKLFYVGTYEKISA